MNDTRTTLLDIYHPMFRKGYQDGRKHYFQENSVFIDKQLVECLQSVFEESVPENAEEREEGVYYSVGQLVGRMSGCVIPRQPDEDNGRDPQEALLVKVRQEYGSTGQALVNIIRQYWTLQDQLAQMLDADSFELMLNRGVEEVPLT